MTSDTERITLQQLRHLSGRAAAGPVVSFYLSPERDTIGHEASVQRLQALVREARRTLMAEPWELSETDSDRLLAPVAARMAEVERGPDESLAWFVSEQGIDSFLVGGPVPDRVTVAPTVDLLPAAAALDDDVEFHLLVLSQNHVNLYHCDGIGWRHVPGDQMPESRADALWHEDYEQYDTIHGGAHVGSGQIIGVHGGGSFKEEHKEGTGRFIRAVARALPSRVRESGLPLVVAAVEYEAALFRDMSRPIDVVLLTSFGSPEHVPISRLHGRAVEVVRERRTAERAALVERYRSLAGTGRTVRGVGDTGAAAEKGQVEVAMIPRRMDLVPEPDRCPLVEVAAAALSHGAAIATVDEIDADVSPIAAILRY
jgi:hypothetical protein